MPKITEPSIFGRCHFGRTKFGDKGLFGDIIDQLEKLDTRPRAGYEPAIIGICHIGSFRIGVKIPLFDELQAKYEKGA